MKKLNPVIDEFRKLGLIKIKNLSIIANTCRDQKVKVLKDNNSKIILLEQHLVDNNHYTNDRNFSKKQLKKYLENSVDDEKRREVYFSKFFNKLVLIFIRIYFKFIITFIQIFLKLFIPKQFQNDFYLRNLLIVQNR